MFWGSGLVTAIDHNYIQHYGGTVFSCYWTLERCIAAVSPGGNLKATYIHILTTYFGHVVSITNIS